MNGTEPKFHASVTFRGDEVLQVFEALLRASDDIRDSDAISTYTYTLEEEAELDHQANVWEELANRCLRRAIK